MQAAEYSQDFDACKQQLVAKGGDFLNKARLGRSKIARKGLSFIHDGAIVLTCSYSRVTLAVLVAAAEANRRFTVYVTESAPSNLGLKFAAKLQEHGIPVTVIPVRAILTTQCCLHMRGCVHTSNANCCGAVSRTCAFIFF